MPIHRMNKRTGKKEWYGKIRLPGGKIKTKKCSNFREARQWETLEIAAIANLSQTATVSLLALINEYLDDLAVRHSKAHYDDVRLVMRRFAQEIGPTRIAQDIPKAEVSHFLTSIADTISPNRANRAGTYIKRLYNWAMDTLDFPSPNPWRVQKFSTGSKHQPVAPLEDFWKIYEIADPQQQKLLILYFHTAARKSEILRLKWEDVDLKARTLTLTTRKRKGGEERDIMPMTNDVFRALAQQRLETGFHEYVFVNKDTGTRYTWANHMIQNLCKKAGVPCFGCHAIRRLAASFVAEHKSLSTVQKLLRHQNLSTTAIYVKQLKGDREELNEVFRIATPKAENPMAKTGA